MLKLFDKGPGWFYYKAHRRIHIGQIKRPDVMVAVREGINVRPATYGYRRIFRYVERKKGIACDPKTVLSYMRQKHWLSTERNRHHRKKRPHTGKVTTESPNKRWSSDIIEIRAWNKEKGRLAMIADCGNIEILSKVWAKSITSDTIKELVKRALRKRFSMERVPDGVKLQFLTDNGSEYIDKELVKWLESVGFEVCNTPVRSPESNGVSEAVNHWIRADYINQNICVSFDDIGAKIPGWIEDYNTMCPHERLGGATAVEFYEEWLNKLAKK